MAYELSVVPMAALQGAFKTQTITGIALDSAFIYETSGDAWYIRFDAPVGQTTDTLLCYVYCSAITGLPTDVRLALYNGPTAGNDPDRPENAGSPLGTSGAVDLSGAGSTWVTFTITGVSLTQGECYYLILDNRTATPGSNYPTILYKGRFWAGGDMAHDLFRSGYSANGFSGDPTIGTAAIGVVKFADGTLLGSPYASVGSHANNQNDRGVRVQFSEDVVVSGAAWGQTATYFVNFEINAAVGGANLVTKVLNVFDGQQFAGCRFAPATLLGGVAYDCVLTLDSSRTTVPNMFAMGEAEGSLPADVLSCRPQGWAHVTGATPGSYSVDTSKWMRLSLVIDDNPAIAGGGGSRSVLLGG